MNHALKIRGEGGLRRGVAATGPQDLCRLATTKYSLQTFRKPKEIHRANVTVTAQTRRFSSRVSNCVYVCVCVLYVSVCVCWRGSFALCVCLFACLAACGADNSFGLNL